MNNLADHTAADLATLPAGTATDALIHAALGYVWDASRCPVCGWTLAPSLEEGCVPGNCALRPPPEQRADVSPRYSTGTAASKFLRNEMEARGWSWEMGFYAPSLSPSPRWCNFHRGESENDFMEFQAAADTEELAAARAAALALKSAQTIETTSEATSAPCGAVSGPQKGF